MNTSPDQREGTTRSGCHRNSRRVRLIRRIAYASERRDQADARIRELRQELETLEEPGR